MLHVKRSGDFLEFHWSLVPKGIVLESAPTPAGPWSTYRQFRSGVTSMHIRLDASASARYPVWFFRAKLAENQ